MRAWTLVLLSGTWLCHGAGSMKFIYEGQYINSRVPSHRCEHSCLDTYHAQDTCVKTSANYMHGKPLWEKKTCNQTHVYFGRYNDSTCTHALERSFPGFWMQQDCEEYGSGDASFGNLRCDVEADGVAKQVSSDGEFSFEPIGVCTKSRLGHAVKLSCEDCKVVETAYHGMDCSRKSKTGPPHWGDSWTCCEGHHADATQDFQEQRVVTSSTESWRLPVLSGGLALLTAFSFGAFRAARSWNEREPAFDARDSEALVPQ